MLRSELQPYLKSIHPGFKVLRYSTRGEHIYHGGNDAVYFYGTFIGAIPPGNIYLRKHEVYKDFKGRTHRSLRELSNRIYQKLGRKICINR